MPGPSSNPALTADLERNMRDRSPRTFLRKLPKPRGTSYNNDGEHPKSRGLVFSHRQKARLFADEGQNRLRVRALQMESRLR